MTKEVETKKRGRKPKIQKEPIEKKKRGRKCKEKIYGIKKENINITLSSESEIESEVEQEKKNNSIIDNKSNNTIITLDINNINNELENENENESKYKEDLNETNKIEEYIEKRNETNKEIKEIIENKIENNENEKIDCKRKIIKPDKIEDKNTLVKLNEEELKYNPDIDINEEDIIKGYNNEKIEIFQKLDEIEDYKQVDNEILNKIINELSEELQEKIFQQLYEKKKGNSFNKSTRINKEIDEFISSDVFKDNIKTKPNFLEKEFVLEEFRKNWPKETNIKCWWCTHNFNGIPFPLPIYYSPNKKKFKVVGCFCSPNCALAYNKGKDKYLIVYFTKMIINELEDKRYIEDIKSAPHWKTLKEYGGILNIEEFRNNFIDNKTYMLYNFPCINYNESININNNYTLKRSKLPNHMQNNKKFFKTNN